MSRRANKRARGLLAASRNMLGYVLGAYWMPLAASWGSRDGPGGFLGVLGAPEGASGDPWGSSCGPL
eukprot:7732691-Pyramimonas_sp.AAC.1